MKINRFKLAFLANAVSYPDRDLQETKPNTHIPMCDFETEFITMSEWDVSLFERVKKELQDEFLIDITGEFVTITTKGIDVIFTEVEKKPLIPPIIVLSNLIENV